jgi:tetratricopeptide (TPR) repeat protein
MIPTQMASFADLYEARIKRQVENGDFEAAYRTGQAFFQASEEIGLPELKAEAIRLIETLTLDEINYLFQEGRSKEAVAVGQRLLLSSTGNVEILDRFGTICVKFGRETHDVRVFELSVEACTKVINSGKGGTIRSSYEQRANAYALLGRIDEAISDYRAVLRLDPQNNSVALCLAEVQIWAGRYGEARISLDALYPRLKTLEEKIIGLWLMCHCLNLEERDFSAHLKELEEKRGHTHLDYQVRDIEPYLRHLDKAKFTETQLQNAWTIQKMVVKSPQ